MSLPPYVLKGTKRAAVGIFGRVQTTQPTARSVAAAVAASTTHTLVGATPLTAELNIITVCASAGDSVSLPVLSPGQSVDVYNNGAAAAAVYPAASGVAIDGGSAGASVTLTNTKRARFTCVSANVIISAQYGVVSA